MGKRFEIACYKNKVLNWRAGVYVGVQWVVTQCGFLGRALTHTEYTLQHTGKRT